MIIWNTSKIFNTPVSLGVVCLYICTKVKKDPQILITTFKDLESLSGACLLWHSPRGIPLFKGGLAYQAYRAEESESIPTVVNN